MREEPFMRECSVPQLLQRAVPLLLWLLVASAAGATPAPRLYDLAPSLDPALRPEFGGGRGDTIWFGGDDGNGLAYEGGVWDWDTIVSDPYQGWTSIDRTLNPAVYFYPVVEDSFLVHEDPCIPLLPGETGMIWCGIHEDEALERDFVAGMGYQNDMCQWALSPTHPIVPALEPVQIGFAYFNDTEERFDYTHVELLGYDGESALIETREMAALDGIIGSPDMPAVFDATLPAGSFDPAVETIRLRLRMQADGGWSDEDGDYDSECGPFGADDVELMIGWSVASYDFDDGAQGWSFDRCPGVGAFMEVVPEPVWLEWVEHAGVACECQLDGNALCFSDLEGSPHWPPGHPIGQKERAFSGIVASEGYPHAEYNAAIARWTMYAYLRRSAGTFYRPGYVYYPYTTEENPTPRWSPRQAQAEWYYTGDVPDCYTTGAEFPALPADWDSLRAVYEVACSCDQFGIPEELCPEEGETWGAPVLDDFRIGRLYREDAPQITPETGHLFMDGFGQQHPFYLEPGDAGNANICYDLSRNDHQQNDWLGDTAQVSGPQVEEEEERWCAELCLRVVRTGPRQQMVPGYAEWRARFETDPELDWACARMDSVETPQGALANKYLTYFHEDDPGFDPRYPDCRSQQEILPDALFVPGTRIEYQFRSYWYSGGAPPEEYYAWAPPHDGLAEFEILPGMRATDGEQGYDFVYPCVLYIDYYNRGGEYYIEPMLQVLGLEYDRYDALNSASCWNAPMRRSYGGTTFNPGGWGNNGCTPEQLYGYRLILLNSGHFGTGCFDYNSEYPSEDLTLLEDWLNATDCGLSEARRGLVLDGDGIGTIMAHPEYGAYVEFCNEVLGADWIDDAYRDYNADEAYCVYLEPAPGGAFEPLAPGVSLYGSGCPASYDFDVLGLSPGVSGAAGNLRYHSYEGTGAAPYVDYSQIVRERVVPGEANWMSVVSGFSLHHLSERGCAGLPCSGDSACVVSGGLDVLIPEILGWMTDPEDPFDPWRYPCTDTGVEEEDELSHLTGPVTYLYPSRPNPFAQRATIRFTLASAQHATLQIFDVSGRCVRTLVDGSCEAGERVVTWDGADGRGHRLASGLYWAQLRTENGYASSKRLVRMGR
ncbi:MAG: T9SS type A sorting domain-containing protein [Candidatus Eisenbacteria bacterium]|nr:T9SS type A sorting domain-containing protein [Candidatus Eisenbacteria bacterium]